MPAMLANHHPVCLTIGTSDCSGSTGIQADLKTFTSLGCYGASILVAANAQNFAGVRHMHVLPDQFVRQQLEAVSDEMRISSVKIGLVPTIGPIRLIARWLRERPDLPLVVDPVAADGRGIPLLQPEALDALRHELLPLATVITPNHFQAALLTNAEECVGQAAMEEVAKLIFATYGCPTVVTGGGLAGECRDVFVGMDGLRHFEGPPPPNIRVVGRGNTFSAAITAGLAKGESLRESILNAKLFLAAAVAEAPMLSQHRNPLWHGVVMNEPATELNLRSLNP